jgi:hypothetical protein
MSENFEHKIKELIRLKKKARKVSKSGAIKNSLENNTKISDDLMMLAEGAEKDIRILQKILEKHNNGTLTKQDQKLLVDILTEDPIKSFIQD